MNAPLTVLALAVTLAGVMAAAQDTPNFHAERIVRTGHFTVEATPAKVFPLFTPLGEYHWAHGWKPEILYPADGHPVEGLLFRTSDHGGMYWWLTRYEPAAYTIEYKAVAPDGLAREIRVQCKAVDNRTEVTVTDTYLGLTEHGNMFIRSLDEAAYAKKMEGWRVPIERYLKTGEDPKQ